MSVILETKQLCKFYGAGENQVKAVNQVDIQIAICRSIAKHYNAPVSYSRRNRAFF